MVIRMMRITEKGKLPTRGSEYAAGYDLYANNDEPITIMPNEIKQIFTDIAMEIPTGYFGAVYARSGLATKQGLRPPNCVGVIDSDYRGNIGVGLINDTDIPQIIQPHERVAQIVIQPCLDVEFELVNELSETERGTGGFGSTGKI